MRTRGRCWSSARPRTARSRWPSWSTCPILIVHVSGREAVEQIRWARAHGLTVFAETCPQYLFLTADDLGIDDSYHGARCVCSPPPRDKANQEVIWDGLNDGLFTVFSLRPRAVPLRRARGQEAGRRGGRVPPHPERHPGHRDAPAAALFRRRARRAHRRSTASSSSPPPTRPRPTACTRARARSRSAATPTW